MSETETNGQFDEPMIKAAWLPVLIGGLLLALVLVLWRMLDVQEETNLRTKVRAECDYLASSIEADLRNRLPALQRMAKAWEIRQGTPRADFVNEAQSYIADVPGFQAIEWVDATSVVRYVIPLQGNEKALNLNLSFEKNRKDALNRARDSGGPTLTDPVDLVQGGKGFLAFFPIFDRGNYDGCILAVFRIGEWLDYVFGVRNSRALGRDFRISVTFDQTPVYEQDGWTELSKNDFGLESEARILDHNLYVRIRPTDAFIRGNRSALPIAMAGFGALLSLLIAFIVGLFQKSYVEAWRSHASRKALEVEVQERKKVELVLQRALVRIELATKAAGMGLWTWDLATNKLSWNDRMFDLFDLPPDVEPEYRHWSEALHPEDRGRTESLLLNAVAGKGVFDTEFRIIVSDGKIRHIRAAARVERAPDGKANFVTGLNWDISEAKGAEAALKEGERQFRLLLNSTGEAIYGMDLEGRCTFANPACARALGFQDSSLLLGKNMHQLIHYSHADGSAYPVESCRIFRAFRDGKPVHADDEVFWRGDGSAFPVEYWSYPQLDGDRILGAVVAFVDVSERKKAEETIKHMATHDGLTDLPSLRLFKDRLQMAMLSARRNKMLAAVLFVDLDGFKAVNDTYGHDAGDEVLRSVARRLFESVRETDTVARMGGDEFLVVLTELQEPENAGSVAEKAIDLIRRPIAFGALELRVGASVGIAVYPDDSDNVEGLIKAADEAMYDIKKGGKNGYAFSPSRAARAADAEGNDR